MTLIKCFHADCTNVYTGSNKFEKICNDCGQTAYEFERSILKDTHFQPQQTMEPSVTSDKPALEGK